MDLKPFADYTEEEFRNLLNELEGDGGAKYSLQMSVLQELRSSNNIETTVKLDRFADMVGSSISEEENDDYQEFL